nr:MAG TPA: hypothetical protein [Caudoviricetes sp.]
MILTISFHNSQSHILIGVGIFLKNTCILCLYVLQYKHNKERR